jgi:uncharacterized membrane protein
MRSAIMTSNRLVNFLIYLIPVVGWLIGLTLLRRNLSALYHSCQALALTLGLVLVPLIWAVSAWLLAWIPVAGPTFSIATFSLVVAAIPAVVIAWVVGMVNALRDDVKQVPVFGAWGEQLFRRITRALQDEPQIRYIAQEVEQ